MLSEPHLKTIGATLPASRCRDPRDHAELLRAHVRRAPGPTRQSVQPDALQKTGAQPQALAGSIAAYAQLQLVPDRARQQFILDRIAHKHTSLGITRDQYQIVHKYLFEAIVEVLGEAVTPEVAGRRGTPCTGRWPTR